MAKIISASIDLDKIDKAKTTIGSNGHRYHKITITLNDEPDKYGNDVSVTENQTADERAAKKAKSYLGNGKTVWSSDQQKAAATKPAPPKEETQDEEF